MYFDQFIKVTLSDNCTTWIRFSDIKAVSKENDIEGCALVTSFNNCLLCREEPHEIFAQLDNPERFAETRIMK